MEFSGTGKSSMIGLSLAGHAEAKLYFETNELPGIFSLGWVLYSKGFIISYSLYV